MACGVAVVTEVADSRSRLAAAVRRLGHDSLAADLADDDITQLAVAVEDLVRTVEGAPRRARSVQRILAQFLPAAPTDGQELVHFDDCFVSGPDNPLGLGMRARVDGDDVVAWVTLRRCHEGGPERAHGGVLAAVFDDALGYLLTRHGMLAFTGELTVRYLAATPIGRRLDLRATMTGQDGRKVFTRAEARDGDDVVATAHAVFVRVDRQAAGPA